MAAGAVLRHRDARHRFHDVRGSEERPSRELRHPDAAFAGGGTDAHQAVGASCHGDVLGEALGERDVNLRLNAAARDDRRRELILIAVGRDQ